MAAEPPPIFARNGFAATAGQQRAPAQRHLRAGIAACEARPIRLPQELLLKQCTLRKAPPDSTRSSDAGSLALTTSYLSIPSRVDARDIR